MTSVKTKTALLAGVSALMFGSVAYTQGIEEIVVTASKRAEGLQDTALSVSAVTGDQLEDLVLTSFDQILGTVPGVTLTEHGPGYSPVAFRGVNVNGNPDSGNPTTSTYLNDFPIGSNIRGPDLKLVDIERVEVLKGPQGTLYGQAAMGGVVRYITKKPEFDEFAGGGDIAYESVADGDGGYWAQGYLNIPVSDNFALRGVLYDYDRPGFVDNVLTGSEDINEDEVTGGRLAARWSISDRVEFNGILTKQDGPFGRASISAGGANSIASTYTPAAAGFPTQLAPPDPDNPAIQSPIDPDDNADYQLLHLSLDAEFDGFDLRLMAADSSLETEVSSNFGIFLRAYDDVTTINGDPGWVDDEFDIQTFEARLTSNGDGPFEWIAGIWHEDNRFDRVFRARTSTPQPDGSVFIFGFPFFPALNDGELYIDENSFRTIEELAGYLELGYSFTDRTKATFGYRRSNVELNNGVTSGGNLLNGFSNPTIGDNNRVEEDINSYKFHLEHKVNDDVLLYALASSGYRAGGVNGVVLSLGQIDPADRQFDTDELWNYEVGARTSWLDGRLIVNPVAYFIDWSDIQLSFFDLNIGQSVTRNAGEARIIGFDLETTLQVTDSLRVGLNYGFVDAELTEDYFQADPLVPVAADGTRLPGSSDHTLTLWGSLQQPLSADLTLQADAFYTYRDSRAPALLTSGTVGPFLPAHDRANISVGLRHSNGVSASVFVQNVFDERDFQTLFNFFPGGSSGSINRPRTIGIQVGYDF